MSKFRFWLRENKNWIALMLAVVGFIGAGFATNWGANVSAQTFGDSTFITDGSKFLLSATTAKTWMVIRCAPQPSATCDWSKPPFEIDIKDEPEIQALAICVESSDSKKRCAALSTIKQTLSEDLK